MANTMELDLSYNGGMDDWTFQSPAHTPINGSFGSNGLQTPKTANFSSHFQDAFITPQMPVYNNTPRMPQYSSMTTPVRRTQASPELLQSFHNASIRNGGSIPSAAHTSATNTMNSTYDQMQQASMQLAMNTSFESSQMQTPPPTRGSSVKKPQSSQPVAFGTPSTIASRRITTPQQAMTPLGGMPQPQTTPTTYPHLQLSPDVYQFANFGPASAPVMPQSGLFWDDSLSTQHDPVTQMRLDDPFAPNASQGLQWPISTIQQPSVQNMSFDTPAMDSFPIQEPHPLPLPTIPQANNNVSLPSTNQTTAVVNPSLLYTSSMHSQPQLRVRGRPRQFDAAPMQMAAQNSTSMPVISPSAIKMPETNIISNSNGLRRSNTTGGTRPRSAQSSFDAKGPLSRSNSVNQPPRTISPLKRFGRPPLGPISEGKAHKRTSVVLTIDENGRARTETKTLEESPTRSFRERYPEIFDSDSSDAESDDSEHVPSRAGSFIFDKRDERRLKAARLDPPVENLEGLELPRSSSRASRKRGVTPSKAAVAAVAQLRRQNSRRRSTPSRNSSLSRSLTTSNSAVDVCPMDGYSSQSLLANGSAESVIPTTTFDSQSWSLHLSPTHNDNITVPAVTRAESTLQAHNRRWGLMSSSQQY